MKIGETSTGKMIVDCENKDTTTSIENKLEKYLGNTYNIAFPKRKLPKVIIYNAELEDVDDVRLKEREYACCY